MSSSRGVLSASDAHTLDVWFSIALGLHGGSSSGSEPDDVAFFMRLTRALLGFSYQVSVLPYWISHLTSSKSVACARCDVMSTLRRKGGMRTILLGS